MKQLMKLTEVLRFVPRSSCLSACFKVLSSANVDDSALETFAPTVIMSQLFNGSE